MICVRLLKQQDGRPLQLLASENNEIEYVAGDAEETDGRLGDVTQEREESRLSIRENLTSICSSFHLGLAHRWRHVVDVDVTADAIRWPVGHRRLWTWSRAGTGRRTNYVDRSANWRHDWRLADHQQQVPLQCRTGSISCTMHGCRLITPDHQQFIVTYTHRPLNRRPAAIIASTHYCCQVSSKLLHYYYYYYYYYCDVIYGTRRFNVRSNADKSQLCITHA